MCNQVVPIVLLSLGGGGILHEEVKSTNTEEI